ncbi:hypothetical protein DMH88_07165 [Escherichia coli]|nr:hypothetical protein [Escherichia coli]
MLIKQNNKMSRHFPLFTEREKVSRLIFFYNYNDKRLYFSLAHGLTQEINSIAAPCRALLALPFATLFLRGEHVRQNMTTQKPPK